MHDLLQDIYINWNKLKKCYYSTLALALHQCTAKDSCWYKKYTQAYKEFRNKYCQKAKQKI
jgi:hypothetical protein